MTFAKLIALSALAVSIAIGSAAPAASPATAPANASTNLSADTIITHLTVHPAAVPRPLMKYRLLPPIDDQTPGNSALFYLNASATNSNESVWKTRPVGDVVDDYLAMPLDKLRASDVDAFLASKQGVFHQLDLAAVREDCHWDLPLREDSFRTLLPYLNPIRGMVRLLGVRFRQQLALGHTDDAARTLETGLALAHHLGQEGVLVQGLVTAASGSLCMSYVNQFQQAPDSPNLYWALSELPRPFVPIRVMFQYEFAMCDFSLPTLQYPIAYPPDPRWLGALGQIASVATSFNQPQPGDLNSAAAAALAMAVYPKAREFLLTRGLTSDQIHDMPAEVTAAMYMTAELRELIDRDYAVLCLPYPQAFAELRAHPPTQTQPSFSLYSNPWPAMIPNPDRSLATCAKLDRDIALARCVDAIRAFAAAHNGNPPAALSDLTDTPAPMNPLTDEPFTYSVTGQTATIDAAGIPGANGTFLAPPVRLEITVLPR